MTERTATIGHVRLKVRDLDRRGQPGGTSEWRGRSRRLGKAMILEGGDK